MKVRVMARYSPNHSKPLYEVDTWVKVFWLIGYWSTQMRTTDFNYAASVFEDYKHDRRGKLLPKDEAVLIHYE